MLPLHLLVLLNDLESRLNETQTDIDELRAMFPRDILFQSLLDDRQQMLDRQRARIMETKSKYINQN